MAFRQQKAAIGSGPAPAIALFVARAWVNARRRCAKVVAPPSWSIACSHTENFAAVAAHPCPCSLQNKLRTIGRSVARSPPCRSGSAHALASVIRPARRSADFFRPGPGCAATPLLSQEPGRRRRRHGGHAQRLFLKLPVRCAGRGSDQACSTVTRSMAGLLRSGLGQTFPGPSCDTPGRPD